MDSKDDAYIKPAGAGTPAPKATGKVLVVDDEQDIVEVLSYLLGNEGYEVVGAFTGREAIDIARAGGVDLVLLDYMLPDITGLEVLKKVKYTDPDIQVIIITGRGSDKLLSDALEAGAAGYVVKPFLNERLVELVGETMGRRRARKDGGAGSQSTS